MYKHKEHLEIFAEKFARIWHFLQVLSIMLDLDTMYICKIKVHACTHIVEAKFIFLLPGTKKQQNKILSILFLYSFFIIILRWKFGFSILASSPTTNLSILTSSNTTNLSISQILHHSCIFHQSINQSNPRCKMISFSNIYTPLASATSFFPSKKVSAFFGVASLLFSHRSSYAQAQVSYYVIQLVRISILYERWSQHFVCSKLGTDTRI